MIAQRALLLLALAASACGERVARNEAGGGATTPPYVRAEEDSSLLREAVLPVRIGELGPGFAACAARGATRDRAGATPIAVRAAPFEATRVIDRLPAGAEFFICARTHDQRWFGIVYDEGGAASERCGVSTPASRRGEYRGACASGWVASAAVRLVSGVPHQLPPADNGPVPPPAPTP